MLRSSARTEAPSVRSVATRDPMKCCIAPAADEPLGVRTVCTSDDCWCTAETLDLENDLVQAYDDPASFRRVWAVDCCVFG